MKNQRIIAIFFLVLLVLSIILFFSNKKSTFKSRISDFSINTEHIDKIIISRAENKILLEKVNNIWIINRSFKVKPAAINFFLKSLSMLEIKSPVSHRDQFRIVNKLITDSKKIEIFDGKRLLKSISVYHDTSGLGGTYMMLGKTNSPFIMKIKGNPDYDINRLFPLDEQIWSDNILFNYLPGDIKNIIIEYPDEPKNSFRITRSSEGRLSLSHPDNKQPINEFNYDNVSDYLNYFTNIRFFFLHEPYSSDLKEDNLFVIITIINNQNVSNILKGYRKYSGKDLQEYLKYDINRFYALVNNDSRIIELKYIDFDPILKDIQYFLKK